MINLFCSLWNDILLIVIIDNGGIFFVGGYNWFFRGYKGIFWEGGFRGVGFVYGKMLKKIGVKCVEFFYVIDWYLIFFYLVGNNWKLFCFLF